MNHDTELYGLRQLVANQSEIIKNLRIAEESYKASITQLALEAGRLREANAELWLDVEKLLEEVGDRLPFGYPMEQD